MQANVSLSMAKEALSFFFPDVEFKRYTKPTFAKPAPEDLRQKMKREVGFVIEALAD